MKRWSKDMSHGRGNRPLRRLDIEYNEEEGSKVIFWLNRSGKKLALLKDDVLASTNELLR